MEKQRGTVKPLCSVQSSSSRVRAPTDAFSGGTGNPFTPPIYVVHILWSNKFLSSKLLQEVPFVKVHWQFFFLNFIFIVDIIMDASVFLPFAHLHPPPILLSLWPPPHRCLCPWVIHTCSSANPSPSFIQSPPPPSTLRAVSLFLVPVLLFLLCSSVLVMLGPQSSSSSPVSERPLFVFAGS